MEGDVYEPDPDLVASARAGELRAFEEIVRRYQADVWRLCYHVLHDETLTDDVTQDVFLRLYRFLPSFRLDSKFSTWVLSIARNSAVDELRRLGRRRRLTERIEAHTIPRAPDETVRVEIREAVAELPIELREPLVLIEGALQGELPAGTRARRNDQEQGSPSARAPGKEARRQARGGCG